MSIDGRHTVALSALEVAQGSHVVQARGVHARLALRLQVGLHSELPAIEAEVGNANAIVLLMTVRIEDIEAPVLCNGRRKFKHLQHKTIKMNQMLEMGILGIR